jgi:HPt (histidine-containing phosphotransfer) domain-containing protein
MEDHVIIDLDKIAELKELLGADYVVEVIDAYNQETESLIQQLQQALAAGDAAAFGRLAHSIKSSSAGLGAVSFSQQARELEMLGKANDLEEVGSKLEQLSADFLQVVDCLKELRNEP